MKISIEVPTTTIFDYITLETFVSLSSKGEVSIRIDGISRTVSIDDMIRALQSIKQAQLK